MRWVWFEKAESVDGQRWRKAQVYERSYWEGAARKIAAGSVSQLNWYRWRAGELERRLRGVLQDSHKKSVRVLEIGSGPLGIVGLLEWGKCVAIDPLEGFYRNAPTLTTLRRPEVEYLPATGESLPFASHTFSLVLVDNVLDHTRAPGRILEEAHRVLVPDGLMYVMVNTHPLWGAILHRALAKAQIDRGHPHTYTCQRVRDILTRHGFQRLKEEIDSYIQARTTDRTSPRLTDKIKGYTGLSEVQYHAICKKTGNGG
jgi:SAM-dependent methyltransferase